MDIPDLEVIVPGATVLGLLVWLIVSLMVQHRADRGDHRDARAALRDEIRELRRELAAQAKQHRQELATAQRDLDTARQRWHDAEDEAARLRRLLAGQDGGSR